MKGGRGIRERRDKMRKGRTHHQSATNTPSASDNKNDTDPPHRCETCPLDYSHSAPPDPESRICHYSTPARYPPPRPPRPPRSPALSPVRASGLLGRPGRGLGLCCRLGGGRGRRRTRRDRGLWKRWGWWSSWDFLGGVCARFRRRGW
jgi:hypothetical protein